MRTSARSAPRCDAGPKRGYMPMTAPWRIAPRR
jgi:hypothetical protein